MSDVQHATALWTESDLRKFRAAIIEECARVAEETGYWDMDKSAAVTAVAAAIRARKDKP